MIEKYSFGKIVVNGVTYTNDIKIVQGRVVSDWWRKKGHSVGIEDIQDILESKPSVLVIGKGQPGMMRSFRSLRRFLKKNDIELIEEKTSQAITTYNSLLQQEKEVSAGFHVSCQVNSPSLTFDHSKAMNSIYLLWKNHDLYRFGDFNFLRR